MDKQVEHGTGKLVDSIQQHLTSYACDLNYDGLSANVVHAAKVRVIDTLGALIAGFFGEPCHIARNLAAQMPSSDGSTIIGTRMKTTPDMAAFVNATTARYVEMTDFYLWPGSSNGHPSDTIAPVLTAAEYAQITGRDFITNVVLAYETYIRLSDVFPRKSGFDVANFSTLATAVAAGKILGLSSDQLSHCISMAMVPNVILRQARAGHISMFKAATAGQAARAGVFAALLARAGMEGPHLPFEGKAGWCDHVAQKRFSLNAMSVDSTSFKIQETIIKPKPSAGGTLSSVLAAEKVAPLRTSDVEKIIVEVPKWARDVVGTGERCWNPQSKESADHSIPYLVAVTLLDGTVTLRSYNDAHLKNPQVRALMQKMDVVENDEFSKAYDRLPQEHWARVTVVTRDGQRLVGETGGDQAGLGGRQSDAQIEAKFRGLAEDALGAKRVDHILDRLWHLEDMDNVAEIPLLFVL